MKGIRHRAICSLGLALLMFGGVCMGRAQAASPVQHSGAQGESLDSIKKLPDWSGVWVLFHNPDEPPDGPGPGGTGGVPLTPKYMALSTAAIANDTQDNMGRCLPTGPIAILAHGVLHEYLFNPGRVTILLEDGEVRRIYTDGRAHMTLTDLADSYEGDSIGYWEDGKTLVVDTVGFPNGELFADHGVRATKNTHLVERIFLADRDHLEIDSVLTDPAIFTRPYTVKRRYKRSELPLLAPSLCIAHDVNSVVDLTPPPED